MSKFLRNVLVRRFYQSSIKINSTSGSSSSFHTGVPVRAAAEFIHDDGSRLEIRGARWPHTLHLPHTWLRDHCRCSSCYNSSTSQRSFDVAAMAPNIRPSSLVLQDDKLMLVWPDGHKSEYSLQFLWQQSYGGRYRKPAREHRAAWTAATFPDLADITVSKSSLLGSGEGLRKLVASIEKYGVGIVDQVEPDLSSTETVVRALAPVARTFYGEMWQFNSNYGLADTAYTNEALGAHTDATYFSQSLRVQVFHCITPADEGGDTLLVDGLRVAQQLQQKHPLAYEFFSKQALSAEYIGDGQHHMSIHTMLQHHPVTGLLQQIRYNLYDRAPLNTLDVSGVQKYYEHIVSLAAIVNNKSAEFWLSLRPGAVLFLDNWRVMHGRSAYTGERSMAGCYVGNEDYTSTARTLGLTQH